MASGRKNVIINTQERALSVDINRLQAFANAADGEIFRYLLNVQGQYAGVGPFVSDDLDAAGIIQEVFTLNSPLTAEIVNGLLVRPQQGSLSLLVDPGVLLALAPDSDPDASNYKTVVDPGVSTVGALNMTANSSGSTRVDVIEVQVSSVVTETDNRDIFNPSTGLFTATSVPKARQDTCTLGFPGASATNIRVRAGTPGAGFPGTATGWLPLAVASVPTGTTAVDTVVFWDVRPLLADRQFAPMNTGTNRAVIRQSVLCVVGGQWTGWLEANCNGRRMGGALNAGEGTSDVAGIQPYGATNIPPFENGFAATTNVPLFLYLVQPFGLPRWARYMHGTPRLPRNPRGIPVISRTPPNEDGSIPIGTPIQTNSAIFGNVASCTSGVCVGASYLDNGGGGTFQAAQGDKEHGWFLDVFSTSGSPTSGNGIFLPSATVTGSGGRTPALAWAITPGGLSGNIPPNARELYVELFTLYSLSASDYFNAYLTSNASLLGPQRAHAIMPSSFSFGTDAPYTWSGWIPIGSDYPNATLSARKITLSFSTLSVGTNMTIISSYARVLGWKM